MVRGHAAAVLAHVQIELGGREADRPLRHRLTHEFLHSLDLVLPGTRTKSFPAGEYQIPVALIIGRRKESTDKKVTLNDALRDFGVSV